MSLRQLALPKAFSERMRNCHLSTYKSIGIIVLFSADSVQTSDLSLSGVRITLMFGYLQCTLNCDCLYNYIN